MCDGPLPFEDAVDQLADQRSRFLSEIRAAAENGDTDRIPVYADEEFGQMKYCEQKAIFEYDSDEAKSTSVKQAKAVNEAAADSLPTETMPPDLNVQLLKQEGHGIYPKYHPTLERNDIWIRCFPDLFVFADRRPYLSIRLRGTKRRYLQSTFENRQLPSWLTCRVMDQLGFDTSELYYIVIRYDTDYYYSEELADEPPTGTSTAEILGTLEMKFADGKYDQIRGALAEFDHIGVDIHEYQRETFADDIYRYIQLWKDKAEPRGADIEGKCKSCEYNDRCTVSLV